VSHDALLSYYVDYYLAEVNNGGFAQFVYNTAWKPRVVALVKQGLSAIGALKHAELFWRTAGVKATVEIIAISGQRVLR
jgi:hypothetical protein